MDLVAREVLPARAVRAAKVERVLPQESEGVQMELRVPRVRTEPPVWMDPMDYPARGRR